MTLLLALGDCHIRSLKKIKKPELGELERAVCTSRPETTATTAGSQDEESRATGDLQKQRTCRDEKKTASASSAMQGPSGKRCSLVWVLNSVVQVSTTP